jgi:hypothetical protein
MNRREMFKRLTGSLAAAGVTAPIAVDALDAPCDPRNALVVISVDLLIPNASKLSICEAWERVTKDTNWEGVRAVVLDKGMKLEVHDLARFGVKR